MRRGIFACLLFAFNKKGIAARKLAVQCALAFTMAALGGQRQGNENKMLFSRTTFFHQERGCVVVISRRACNKIRVAFCRVHHIPAAGRIYFALHSAWWHHCRRICSASDTLSFSRHARPPLAPVNKITVVNIRMRLPDVLILFTFCAGPMSGFSRIMDEDSLIFLCQV